MVSFRQRIYFHFQAQLAVVISLAAYEKAVVIVAVVRSPRPYLASFLSRIGLSIPTAR